jgi:large subunit ribosomal protein L17e
MQEVYTLPAAKSSADDIRAHYKNTFETAAVIRGMKLLKAMHYLQDVIDHKQIVPFRKFTGKVGRKAQCHAFNAVQGAWPSKSAQHLLDLLKNLKSNAEQKGLNPEKLTINHVQVNRAQKGRRRTYKAHGRIKGYDSSPCHIELWASEDQEAVPKAPTKEPKLTKKQFARKRLSIGKKKVSEVKAVAPQPMEEHKA